MSVAKGKNFRNRLAIFLSLLAGSLIVWIAFLRSKKKNLPSETIREILSSKGFNSESIKYWTAVSRHETGGWKSNLFVNYNNGFGMGVPNVRESLRSGQYYSTAEQQNFSTYISFEQCVRDLVIWCEFTKFPKVCVTIDDFLASMRKRGYFTDPDYEKKVKAWLTKPL